MSLSNSIGGYFELELNDFGTVYHDHAIALNSGRNSFEFILLEGKYKKVYLPYYICDVVVNVLVKNNIDYRFYYLNDDFTPKIGEINKGEAVLYVNYFGVCDINVNKVINTYERVIIDNTQAFFSMPEHNIPTFYSTRKFFGVPDGGFAYCKVRSNRFLQEDHSAGRVGHLLARIEHGARKGYSLFRSNENHFDTLPLLKMSKLTLKMMRNIDFNRVAKIRNENFIFMQNGLRNINEFPFSYEKNKLNGPFVYPFLKNKNNKLREILLEHNIFIPKYWDNVDGSLVQKNVKESYIVENLLPLPIDQRLTFADLSRIVNIINKFYC